MTSRSIKTLWELWSYDVWGNARDGYEVNDRSCFDRACEITITSEICNPGTPMEFEHAYPSDKQIRVAFGIHSNTRLDVDGDDLTIYINRERDGYHIGEMHCTSHECLSPVRAIAEKSL